MKRPGQRTSAAHGAVVFSLTAPCLLLSVYHFPRVGMTACDLSTPAFPRLCAMGQAGEEVVFPSIPATCRPQATAAPEPQALAPPPVQVRLASVDHYASPTHGVWHPDSLPLRMAWQGSGSSAADGPLSGIGWFSPWAKVPAVEVVDSFTERLPGEAAALQWAMPLYGGRAATAAERGNLPMARQDQKPAWLSKPAFLAFGLLRAYARLQGRRLCTALQGRLLPLEHPAVQCLIRQALYHLGELSGGGTGASGRLWRSDWGGDGDAGADGVLGTLHAELAALADELANAPREHGAVLLLGELAAYLSDWHAPLRDVARRFAAAAEGWADDLEAEAAQQPPELARPTRAKQCQLRATALLCHAAGQLSDADVEILLGLAVQVHNGGIYGSGTPLEKPLQRLQVGQSGSSRGDAVHAVLGRTPRSRLHPLPCRDGFSGAYMRVLIAAKLPNPSSVKPALMPSHN